MDRVIKYSVSSSDELYKHLVTLFPEGTITKVWWLYDTNRGHGNNAILLCRIVSNADNTHRYCVRFSGTSERLCEPNEEKSTYCCLPVVTPPRSPFVVPPPVKLATDIFCIPHCPMQLYGPFPPEYHRILPALDTKCMLRDWVQRKFTDGDDE